MLCNAMPHLAATAIKINYIPKLRSQYPIIRAL